METIERDYSDKVNFYYVYKSLAHPEWDGYVTPFTLEERLAHVDEAKRTLHSNFTWICDAMDNRLKHELGDRPNSEFIVDPEGVIVNVREWSDPPELRKDMEYLFGAVENPTTVEDLDYVYEAPPTVAAYNVVPRVRKPGRMIGMQFTPEWSRGDEPWYAKLRPEASIGLFREGSGQLYLGFSLDPIYKVHWNNLDNEAIRVKIEAPEGVTVSKTLLTGPKVDIASDIDPREFIIDVSGASRGDVFTITTSYFACNDAAGWCKPIEQRYQIRLEPNRDNFGVFPDQMNKAFNDELGRSKGKSATTEGVKLESRLSATPSPEMVKRGNERIKGNLREKAKEEAKKKAGASSG